MRRTLFLPLLTLVGGMACSQTVDVPSFEVVSIKSAAPPTGGRVRPGCSGGPGSLDPGLLNCSSVTLADIIFRAYSLQPFQFSPPDWMRLARFDIQARIPAGTTGEQMMRMAQRMLAERFQLKLHHEQKEMLTYELTIGKGGSKLKESTRADGAPSGPVGPGRSFTVQNGFPVFPAGRGGLLGLNGRFRWTAFHQTMDEIVTALIVQVGAPVIDETGLRAKYDVDLYWMQESTNASSDASAVTDAPTGPILLRAIQEQWGLKLTAKKSLGDTVVVDHAAKVPLAN